MLTATQMRDMAQATLGAAKTCLLVSPEFAIHSAGLALEMQMKARIVEHQSLAGWPENTAEFKTHGLIHLRKHDLHDLLVQSGMDTPIKAGYMAQWSVCQKWTPDSRYKPVGSVPRSDAEDMIRSVEELLPHL